MSDKLKRRNPVARSPLLRKGGVHEKSVSAKRRQQKLSDNCLLDDWREELEFEREMKSIIDQIKVDDAFLLIGIWNLYPQQASVVPIVFR